MAGYESSSTVDYSPVATSNQHAVINHDEPRNGWPAAGQTERNIWERISTFNVFVICLGSVLLITPCVILGMMWRESILAISGGEPNMLWIQIVHADWTSRLVTVCTAVIRAVMALQASLFTAMIGSIVLEKIGTSLSHAPFYSIIRGVSASPNSLLFASSIRPKSLLALFVSFLAVAEILLIVVSQFLSTILISDFSNSEFTDINNSTSVPILGGNSAGGGGGGGFEMDASPWWKIPPASNWMFGELSDPFSEGSDFHDTGHTYRAFIPFDDESRRTSLRRFHGPAPVMDHRVVCISPAATDMILNTTVNTQGDFRLSGTLSMGGTQSYPGLRNTDAWQSIEFDCGVQIPLQIYTTFGYFAICPLLTNPEWTVQMEDPLVDPTFNDSTAESLSMIYGNPRAAAMFMVIETIEPEAIYSSTRPPAANVSVLRRDGPWAIVNNGSSSDTDALRISTCFTNFAFKTSTVRMESSWPGSEPKSSWIQGIRKYNTTSSQHQLRASMEPGSLRDRGLLKLQPRSEWKEDVDRIPEADDDKWRKHWWFNTNLLSVTPSVTSDSGLFLSRLTYSMRMKDADGTHADLFQAIIRSTQSPALALQALLARGAQMLFYHNLLRFNTTQSAVTKFSTKTSVPARWTGFIVSVALISSHFAVLAVTILLFAFYTRSSLIGNYWHAISQVVSEDTLPVLDRADAAKDKEVERWGKTHMPNLALQSYVRLRPNGRIALGTEEKAG